LRLRSPKLECNEQTNNDGRPTDSMGGFSPLV